MEIIWVIGAFALELVANAVGLLVPQLGFGNWTQQLLSRGVPFEGTTQVSDSSQIKLSSR